MNTLSAGPGARPYGILLILIGLVALVASGEIRQRSHAGEGDPGPRSVPRVMAAALMGGGTILVIGSFFRRREPQSPFRGTLGEGGGEGIRKDEGRRMKDEVGALDVSPSQGPHQLGYYYDGQRGIDRGTLDVILLLVSLPIYLLAMTAADSPK
jgi:hypothetical protein